MATAWETMRCTLRATRVNSGHEGRTHVTQRGQTKPTKSGHQSSFDCARQPENRVFRCYTHSKGRNTHNSQIHIQQQAGVTEGKRACELSCHQVATAGTALHMATTPSAFLSIVREDLYARTLPFWLKHSPDAEFGGFFNCLDEDGAHYDTKVCRA